MITLEEYQEYIKPILLALPYDRHEIRAYIHGIRDCALSGDKDFFLEKLEKLKAIERNDS